jgi:hypothetical protein
MKLSYVSVATLIAITSASPTNVLRQAPVAVCAGSSGSPQCCATDVLGLVDLDCATRMCNNLKRYLQHAKHLIAPQTPTSIANFGAICAAVGQRARCCVLPIVSQIC